MTRFAPAKTIALYHSVGCPECRGTGFRGLAEAMVAKAATRRLHDLHHATAFSVNGSLYENLPFDYRKDFDPVFLVGLVAKYFVLHAIGAGDDGGQDVIAYAKASPDGIDMASSGNGTLQHLLLELFKRSAGIKINHIPYRGGGLAITDVMAGQVKFVFSNGSAVVGLVKSGKVKAIAQTGKGRLASLPDIPAMSDTLPEFQGYDWNGVFVPHGTPAAWIAKLNAGLNKALASPLVSTRFAELNVELRDTRSKNSAPTSTRRWRCGAASSKTPISNWVEAWLRPTNRRHCRSVPQPKRPRQLPPPGAWDSPHRRRHLPGRRGSGVSHVRECP